MGLHTPNPFLANHLTSLIFSVYLATYGWRNVFLARSVWLLYHCIRVDTWILPHIFFSIFLATLLGFLPSSAVHQMPYELSGPQNWSNCSANPMGSSSNLLNSFLNIFTSEELNGTITTPIPPWAPASGGSLRGYNPTAWFPFLDLFSSRCAFQLLVLWLGPSKGMGGTVSASGDGVWKYSIGSHSLLSVTFNMPTLECKISPSQQAA